MFKIPSLQQLFHGFAAVIKRFPFEIIASVIGTSAASILIKKEEVYTIEQIQILTRILLCSILALTLFLSVSVYVEQQKISRQKSLPLRILSVLLLVAFYFLLHPIDNTANIFRYGFLFTAFHLLVSFAPFIRLNHVPAFWEYNKRLFLRILTAGLYSAVLYAGLSIAILSTDVLFNLELDGKIYGYLLSFVFGIFNTAFFLAGVPSNWAELEEQQSYPKGLKIFTQFVLIPLATIYLAILLTYEGKVIVEWSLPKGIVSSLVLGYAVYGILSILLIHPIRHDEGNKWIKTFSRLFYVLLIPLIALLSVAIGARIQQYGITESRYIIVILSVWLTGITAYFLIRQSQNIKVIPISLCILALLCTWGPQSASSVSLRSQMNRLIAFFEKYDAVKNGKLVPLDKTKKSNDGWDIAGFIVDRYGSDPFRDYLSADIDSLTHPADTIKINYSRNYQRASIIKDYLGLRYEYTLANNTYSHHYSYTPDDGNSFKDSIDISGFSFLMEIYYNGYDSILIWKPKDLEFSYTRDKQRLISFDLRNTLEVVIADSVKSGYLIQENQEKNARLVITNISFSKTDSLTSLYSLGGYILIKK